MNTRATAAQALRLWVIVWWSIGVLTLLIFGVVAVGHMNSDDPRGAGFAIADLAYGLASLLWCVWLAHLSRGVAELLAPATETAPAPLSVEDRRLWRWSLFVLIAIVVMVILVLWR